MSTDVPYSDVANYIIGRAGDFKVDPQTALAFLYAENVGPNGELPVKLATTTKSPKGALGPMQVMPQTHEGLVRTNFLPKNSRLEGGSWQEQTDAGLAAIAEMQLRAGTDPATLAAHYNGGTMGLTLAKAGKFDMLTPETQRYLKNVSTYLGQGQQAGSSTGPATLASQGDVRRSETGVGAPNIPAGPAASVQARSGADAIASLMDNYKLVFGSLVENIVKSREDQAAAGQVAATEIRNAGTAAAAQAGADGAVVAAATEMRGRILDLFNLNTRNQDNLISQSLAEQLALQAKRKPLAKEIDDRMGVGFFDDPLQWLVNQTVLPGLVQQHNALARKENETFRTMTTAQGAANVQEHIDIAADVDTLAKQTAAIQKSKLAQAQAEAAKVDVQTAATRAQAALQIGHLFAQEASLEAVNLQRSAALQVQAERNAATEAQRREVAAAEAKLKNIGDSIGATGVSLQSLKGRGQKAVDAWQKRANTGRIGDSLEESVTFIREYGNLDVMASTGKAEQAKFIRDTITKAGATRDLELGSWATQRPGQKQPGREEWFSNVLERTQRSWDQARAVDMGLADKDNPYIVNHSTMAKNFKGDPNNIVYQMVRGALEQGITVDDKKVFGAVEDAVKAGTLDQRAAAAQLSEYYRYGVQRNNAALGFELLGMEKQSNYVLRPKDAEIGVDLTNQVALENFLTGKKASSDVLKYFGVMGPGPAAIVLGTELYNKKFKGSDKNQKLKLPSAGNSSSGSVSAPEVSPELGVAP